MNKIIKSCLEVLKQGEYFLNSVSDESYTYIVKPYFISSSGQHMRHIIDHFVSIKESQKSGTIDYDKRNRGCEIEQKREIALLAIADLKNWVLTLNDKALSMPLIVNTEVALSETITARLDSSLTRELVFAASHAVHHFSTMATIIEMQNFKLDNNFGIAPATASFLRNQNTSCAHLPG